MWLEQHKYRFTKKTNKKPSQVLNLYFIIANQSFFEVTGHVQLLEEPVLLDNLLNAKRRDWHRILHKQCLAKGPTGKVTRHPFTGKGTHCVWHTHTQMAGMTPHWSRITLLNLSPRDWAVLQPTRLSGVRGNISEALYLYQLGAPLFPPLKLAPVNS